MKREIASSQFLPLIKSPLPPPLSRDSGDGPPMVLQFYDSKHFESTTRGIVSCRSGVMPATEDGVVTQRKRFTVPFSHWIISLIGDVNYRRILVEVEEDDFILL